MAGGRHAPEIALWFRGPEPDPLAWAFQEAPVAAYKKGATMGDRCRVDWVGWDGWDGSIEGLFPIF